MVAGKEQIIVLLKEQRANVATADVCRRHGISSVILYNGEAKFGGLKVSEVGRLRSIEEEHTH
jgi:putative transposase